MAEYFIVGEGRLRTAVQNDAKTSWSKMKLYVHQLSASQTSEQLISELNVVTFCISDSEKFTTVKIIYFFAKTVLFVKNDVRWSFYWSNFKIVK
jgi:hypothetical protein